MNNDGLLDLLFSDGSYSGGAKRLIVLENKGNLTFEDAGDKYGFPTEGTMGLGLAIGDVNNDGVFDIFVAGSNRLFVSSADRKYHEVQPGTFIRPRRRESMACGAAFGDLNGDGLLDLVTTEHSQPSQNHVYLNKGIRDGDPHFVSISKQAGLGGLFPGTGITGVPVKNADVHLRDVDNDGKLDIMLAVIYRDKRGLTQPLVLRNLGNRDGIPHFTTPPYDRLLGYYAPTPIADYDRDGRVDIFCVAWFKQMPSHLFRNVTEGGHWLTVRVVGDGKKLNTMGVGAVVKVYKSGSVGKADALLGRSDIAIGTGYSTGEEALAHIGLGDASSCDLEVTWGDRRVVRRSVRCDQHVTIELPSK